MEPRGLYIGGKWRESQEGGLLESLSPVDGQVLGQFQKGSRRDLDLAVEAALGAFAGWRGTPAPRRGEILLRAGALLKERKEELASTISLEMGKVLAEARGEVQEAIDFLEYVAGEGRRFLGQTTPSELPGKICMTVRQPVGIVGCITPWNFPLAVPVWKLGAALIAGNCVVFKPASLTPLCAVRLVEVLEEAGIPPGILNMVVGEAQEVGQALVEHPAVRAISFTGGLAAGRDVYWRGACGLKRVGLELGGKNPMIVLEDADLDLAVDGALFGAFGTSGQRCTSTSRLILQAGIHEPMLGMLLERIRGFKLGHPLDDSVQMGPVSGPDQEKKILGYISLAHEEGARLLCGGTKALEAPLDRGHFIYPTVFEVAPHMRIAREEIFGPVLSVIRVKDYQEAIEVANQVDYGLSSSIYTRDINLAFRAIQDLETGITYVNAPTIGAEVHLPFGGVKHSGNGTREAGPTAIEEFTELKTVFLDYSGRLQKAQMRQENY